MSAVGCPLCGQTTFPEVLRLHGVPMEEGRFAATGAEAAIAARATVALHHCTTCGLVYDTAARLDPVQYDDGYTTFMGFSPSFARHVEETAARLVERYGLVGGTVVDIACGFGDFMQALLRCGMGSGVGIDPAAGDPQDPRITVHREYFSPELLPSEVGLVSCRHMLYLLDDPVGFLRGLRGAIGDRDIVIYLELMNQESALLADPWDVTYEHRSYFTVESAIHLLQIAGFEPIDVHPCHSDRFLSVEARPAATPADRVPPSWASGLPDALSGLQSRADARIAEWREALARIRTANGRFVAWCAGARAISFLALAEAGPEVAAVVDLSPSRQGRFVPGSARPVVAPAAITELAPQAILVTNAVYTHEIRDGLATMGLGGLPVIELDDPAAPAELVQVTGSDRRSDLIGDRI